MGQRSWRKKYGVHIAICMAIMAVAFGMDRKIEIDRGRQYFVSEPPGTFFREVTGAEAGKDSLTLFGWGFDAACYNESSRCELILQDVETGEALWPKMGGGAKPVQMEERYGNGGDFSKAGFEGQIRLGKLGQERVYEVLLRYSAAYEDQAGERRQYVRTVTTDKFLVQGRLVEYDPRTFIEPEIDGTELWEELEGVKLFWHYPEGMWVYYDEERLYYIMDGLLAKQQEGSACYLHWTVGDSQSLPEDRRPYGFGNGDFPVSFLSEELGGGRYRVAAVQMPSDAITYLDTGLFNRNDGKIFGKRKQLELGSWQ